MTQDFKVDGFILVASICRDTDIIDMPDVECAFNISMEDDDDNTLGTILKYKQGYRVVSDADCNTYSRMQGAVRRVWELSNEEIETSEQDEWASVLSQMGEMGINLNQY